MVTQYVLLGAELNQMSTLLLSIESKTPGEPELLLFAGTNDHSHAARLLQLLREENPTPKESDERFKCYSPKWWKT